MTTREDKPESNASLNAEFSAWWATQGVTSDSMRWSAWNGWLESRRRCQIAASPPGTPESAATGAIAAERVGDDPVSDPTTSSVPPTSGRPHGSTTCEEMESMYHKVVMVALDCDPIPASQRADDQLEPPWEVFARMKRERDAARSAIGRADWRPMHTAPLDGTEVEILFRHHTYWTALKVSGPEEAEKQWQAVQRAKWIDHNGGGWTWHGMSGQQMAWRPCEQVVDMDKANG